MCDALLRACAMLGEVQLSLLTVKSHACSGHSCGLCGSWQCLDRLEQGWQSAGMLQD